MPPPMRPKERRVVIIGAGAIGSHMAASLRERTPVLIVDPCARTRAAFRANGVDSVCPREALEGELAEGDPRRIRAGDVVVLTTSASNAAGAVEHVPDIVPVVCLANGLMPALAQARSGSLSHGVVEFAVSCASPGVATMARAGWLTLDRDSLNGATAWLAEAMDPRLQRVRLTGDIGAHRHAKLMLNSSLDPVAAVIGGSIGDVFRTASSFRAFRTLLRESLRVASAAGWRLAAVQGMRPEVLSAIFHAPLVGRIAAGSAARQSAGVQSTLSREVGRGELGEAECLSGAIIREGARVGVPTPAHARAMEVLRRLAATPGGGGGGLGCAAELLQR